MQNLYTDTYSRAFLVTTQTRERTGRSRFGKHISLCCLWCNRPASKAYLTCSDAMQMHESYVFMLQMSELLGAGGVVSHGSVPARTLGNITFRHPSLERLQSDRSVAEESSLSLHYPADIQRLPSSCWITINKSGCSSDVCILTLYKPAEFTETLSSSHMALHPILKP